VNLKNPEQLREFYCPEGRSLKQIAALAGTRKDLEDTNHLELEDKRVVSGRGASRQPAKEDRRWGDRVDKKGRDRI